MRHTPPPHVLSGSGCAARRGFTLLELIVVLAVLGVMTGVVGIALRPAPQAATDAGAAWRRTVAVARARALTTGSPVRIAPASDSAFTAFPDGSVLAERGAPLDRFTGAPAPATVRSVTP